MNNILGASEYAKKLNNCESDIQSRIYSSGANSLMPYMYKEVDDSWREASRDGWDGPLSKAISYNTKVKAGEFITKFPLAMVNMPTIWASADGAIGFEWEKNGLSLTILVKEGRLIYSAFLEDDDRKKASITFKFKIPNELQELITKFGVL